MHTSDSKIAPKKCRYWATIVYPESAPDNWLDILSATFVPAYVSPLHDKDLTDDGNPKKSHYHVILSWPRQVSYSSAFDLFRSFGGVGCQRINAIDAAIEYLWHKNNPDKAQYSRDSVVLLNGAVIKCDIDSNVLFGDFVQLCLSLGCTNLKDAFCVTIDHPEYLPILRNDAYALNCILKSCC